MYIQTKQPFPLFSSFCCPVASNIIKEVDAGDEAIELKKGGSVKSLFLIMFAVNFRLMVVLFWQVEVLLFLLLV
jgi:hypothetical protein